jgi:PEP-CTERM motif
MVTKLIASCVIVGSALLQYATASAGTVGTIGPPTTVNPIPGVDPPIDFTFNLGGNIGFGSLSTTDEGGGQFLATSGTLTVTSGADFGSYAIVAGGPSATLSPSGAFNFDNLVMPGSNPSLDVYGLLFSNGSGKEINIWGTGTSSYSFWDHTSSGYGVQYNGPSTGDFFTATVVPLPTSYTLLLGGLGVIVLFALRNGRKSAMIVA